MARFRFKMDSLLKLRENLEEQKKNEFGKAAAELERQKRTLARLNDEKSSMVQAFQVAVKEQIDPLKSDMFNKYIKLVSRRIEEQIAVVKKAEVFLEEKRVELVEATQEKKKLEKLKEKQFQQYLIDEKREEQKITDEVVSYQTYSKGV